MPALYNIETSTQRRSKTRWPVLALKPNRWLRLTTLSQIGRFHSKMKWKIEDGFQPVLDPGSFLTLGSIGEAKGRCSPMAAAGPSSKTSSRVWRDARLQHPVKVVSRHVACLSLVSVWQCGQWTGACTAPQSSVEISAVGPVQPALAAGGL